MAAHDKKNVTIIDHKLIPHKEQLKDDIRSHIHNCLESYKLGRAGLEDIWMNAWAAYFGTPDAQDFERSRTLEVVGNVGNDWRHKINTGKGYEIVETIHGYFMSAIFPNSQWFTIESQEPMHQDMARLLRKYFAQQLDNWNFRSHMESFLRQLIITGTSCLFMPWRDGKIKYEVLDNFDIFVDPEEPTCTDSPLIRRMLRTRVEILKDIRAGIYEDIAEYDLVNIGGRHVMYEHDADRVRQFQGLNTDIDYSLSDKLEVIEYWGDIVLEGIAYHDYYAVVVGDHLVRFEKNPYKAGRPFTLCTYTPIVRQPYGMGALQSSMGVLHELNLITNQRLDNVEIAVNTMFTKKASSILRTEDVWVEPGRVFEVTEHDDLQPVAVAKDGITVSYQEAGLLESTAEKNTGTGPLVSTGQPRGGERVTAAEVSMVREAGSNRLSNNHKHIENTGIIPILKTTLANCRQFETKDEIVRIAGVGAGEFNYYQVGALEIRNQKFVMKPRGADYIIEQRDYIQKRTAFIQLVVATPQFEGKIDFDKILLDLLHNWGFEEPEAYLTPQQSEQQQANLQPEPGSVQAMGGAGLQQALDNEILVDGGESLMQNTTGMTLPQGMDNDLLKQLFEQQSPGSRGVPLQFGASPE